MPGGVGGAAVAGVLGVLVSRTAVRFALGVGAWHVAGTVHLTLSRLQRGRGGGSRGEA
jgi:hypothetical protein